MCHGSPFIYNALSKMTGISPIEYIQQFRIVKAAKHLLHTNQPIKKCTAVGIENPEYFATLFKNWIYLLNIEKNEMKEGYNNEFLQNNYIYWTLLTHANWKFHIAATETGLCFIGSQNETFEEVNIWARKTASTYIDP